MNKNIAIARALLLAASSAAAAQPAPRASSGAAAAEAQLPEISVQGGRDAPDYNPPSASSATKIDAPLRDIPQTVNVVPQTLMRDQGVRSMEEALRNVPGIGLSHGDGQRDQVTIRGFSAIADQFVDGLRDDALYFRDLSNIERIEVLKGPASVLYGRGSSGGLINRITKKPGIDVSELTGQLGRWNQRRAQFDFGRAWSESIASFRVTGAIERADSYRSQQFLDREVLSPSLLMRLSGATQLHLQAEHLSDRRVTDFGVPAFQGRPVNVAPSTYYGAANAGGVDTTQTRVAALNLVLTHRFSEALTLRNAFRTYDYDLDRNNTLPGSVNEAARTVSLNRSSVQRAESGFFNQTELVHKARAAGLQHQLLYGVEISRQRKDLVVNSRNNIATVALFNPVLPVLPLGVPGPPTADNLARQNVASVYLQDLVTLSARWKALAGLRYDRFEQETLERRPRQPNLARTDREVSPRAGLVYQPTDMQSYYLSVSKSFQPSGETFALAANNAQLAPEETTNREIGAKLDFLEGRASMTASLFRLERTNIKFVDPTTNRIVPIGTQRTDGLELTFAGQLPAGWQLWTGYAFYDAEVTQSVAVDAGQRVQGKRPTLTPRQSANLWAVKSLGGGWGAGGGVTAVGNRAANPGNTVTLPGYAVLDAVAYWRSGPLDLQLNLFNLLNRRYTISGHGTSPHLNLPGAPRSLQLTARYRF